MTPCEANQRSVKLAAHCGPVGRVFIPFHFWFLAADGLEQSINEEKEKEKKRPTFVQMASLDCAQIVGFYLS